MKKVCIVVPAHNEQNRIGRMLSHYTEYFQDVEKTGEARVNFIVVLNGCTDNTAAVVEKVCAAYDAITCVNLQEAGKGLAVKVGFEKALATDAHYIGFVDADMATQPTYFQDLIREIGHHGGIIASRYMKGARAHPQRPWIKRVGRSVVYNGLVRLLFGMNYQDLQCGAKLFTRDVIATITPHLQIAQWAFDVELLYLCKRYKFPVKELPTVWYDQDESKLRVMSGGMRMLGSLVSLRWRYLTSSR